MIVARTGKLPSPEGEKLKINVRDHTPWRDIFGNMLVDNRERSIPGLVLMIAQAFFFNAVFFTYGLIVKKFLGVADRDLPMQLVPFALGSFLGPVLLGPLFDRVGRKPMIIATYGIAGLLLVVTAIPFAMGRLTQHGLSLCFSVTSL